MKLPLREGSPEAERFDRCSQSVRIELNHDADVGEVRRTMRAAAVRAGFRDEDAERVAIVTTECGKNVVRHGGGGSIIVSRVQCPDPGFEIVAIDAGPGIPDIQRAIEDGYSTGGTSGLGLGAIRRQSDVFDAHSAPGGGTIVLARVLRERAPAHGASRSIAGICLPKKGEEVSGDAWTYDEREGAIRLMVADGLGHGYAAADASVAAIERFRDCSSEPVLGALESIHESLRPTRGAAVSIADIVDGASIDYSGLGNVRGLLIDAGQTRELIGMNGTAGHRAGRMKVFSYQIGEDPILILHSDGLKSKWKIEDFRGLRARHPGIIAALLLRECERHTDDVCVVVWKGGRD